MQLIRLAHCVYHCEYHIVIVTKYRREIFNQGVFAYLKERLAEVTEHYPQIKIREINHDKDHLHLLILIPPTIAVGKAIGIIKVNAARNIKQKFSFIYLRYIGKLTCSDLWS